MDGGLEGTGLEYGPCDVGARSPFVVPGSAMPVVEHADSIRPAVAQQRTITVFSIGISFGNT